MVKRILMPLIAAIIIMAMVVPGCGGTTDPTVEYTLTISSTAGGSVTIPGEGAFKYAKGTIVPLFAVPEDPDLYAFVAWTGDIGTLALPDTVRGNSITMNDNYTIVAEFEEGVSPEEYFLFVGSTAGGSVTTPGEGVFGPYNPGDPAQDLVAVADSGNEFLFWSGGGDAIVDSTLASTSIEVDDNYAIYANFSEARETGFWFDAVTIEKEPNRDIAIGRLQADRDALGAIDVYAHTLNDAGLFTIVDDDEDLWYKSSIGSFNTLRINPYGPEFTTGMLNPFHFPEMQMALHKYIDRTYIAMDIMQGLGWERFTSFHPQLPDYARFLTDTYVPVESSIQYLEDKYDWDETVGWTWVQDAVDAINADPDVPGTVTWDAGLERWKYEGDVIGMTIAIRNDDPIRDQIGDYLVLQLKKMGFEAVAFKGNMAATLSGLANVEAETISGGWTMYTGGWVSTVLVRDESYWFIYFHSSLWQAGIPAFKYLEVPDEFYDAAWDLLIMNFTTIEEPGGRDDLVGQCLPTHMEYGMFYLTASRGFSPLREIVDVAADKAGGIYGSWMWALTGHFRDGAGNPQLGGHLKVAMHDLLVEPWNPVAGSNTVYDMFPIRATGDMAHHPDTRDGLRWAGRITNAEVTITTGLPALSYHDWVDLSFAAEIVAPGDAWRDWDPVTQQPRTVADALANPAQPWGLDTAVVDRYSVAYYPKGADGIWNHPLHDFNTIDYADFLYAWILSYDRGQAGSAIFDPAAVSGLTNTRGNVVGVRFTVGGSADDFGLKYEQWSTVWEMDAERMVGTGFPNYAQGNGFWHTLAPAILGERAGNMAFGEVKAQPLSLGWINFLNRDIMLGELTGYVSGIRALDPGAYADANVPYYDFIEAQYAAQGVGNTFASEIKPRMDNLFAFVSAKNHFWVGSGPYYLDDYSYAGPWVRLAAFPDYPDDRERWFFLLEDLI